MKKKTVRQITDNALVAAIYYVMTILLSGFAFYDIQFRIAEIFLFLIFFRKDFIIGVSLGCFLVNLHSPLWPWDPIFGTLATALSGGLIAISKRKEMGMVYPTIINGVVVGFMLYLILDMNFFASSALVAAGELVVLILGYFILKLLETNESFLKLIMAENIKEEHE